MAHDMKRYFTLLLILSFSLSSLAQKTLLVEKVGKRAKYYYHAGEKIKIQSVGMKKPFKGILTVIRDSSIVVSSIVSEEIKLKEIQCVYKQFPAPRKLGIRLSEFGAVIFLVMVANNLLNHTDVFTQYTFIVSGAFLGAGLISLAFSERPCKIGSRWKIKILDGMIR
jgi:hypothetical protein